MTPLRSFLAEIQASAKVQAALAGNKVLQAEYAGAKFAPRSTADVLAGLERWVDQAENDDSLAVIEIHDAVCEIVRRNAPVKQRLDAFLAYLGQHWRPQ